jgi:hypothetical protein
LCTLIEAPQGRYVGKKHMGTYAKEEKTVNQSYQIISINISQPSSHSMNWKQLIPVKHIINIRCLMDHLDSASRLQ